jgi:hypothetical protein
MRLPSLTDFCRLRYKGRWRKMEMAKAMERREREGKLEIEI